MSLQYISDSTGKTAGVFIPINEWNELKSKFKGIETEELDISKWHIDILNERLIDCQKNPGQALDFDGAMDDINNVS